MFARRWQDEPKFVKFLRDCGYDRGLTDGMILYMWEAWRGALGWKPPRFQRDETFEIEEQDMATKKATKKFTAKKATKKATTKKPSAAKKQWLKEQQETMAADPTIQSAAAPARDGVNPRYDDLEREQLLKKIDSATSLSSDDIAALRNHLKHAHEKLKTIDDEHDEIVKQIQEEHKKEMEKLASEGAKALVDGAGTAEDLVKQAKTEGQDEALKEIATMFGALSPDTPDQAFAFLQAQVKLRDMYQVKAGAKVVDGDDLQKQLTDALAARDVASEQLRVAEKEREAALSAARNARKSEDELMKKLKKATETAQNETLMEIAQMLGANGECKTPEAAFQFLSERASTA